MSKVLFLNIADYDHVYSTLGIAQELIKRGEEVIYSTSDNFKEEVEFIGARFKSTNYFTGVPSAPPFVLQQSLMDVMYSSVFYNLKRKKQLLELIFDDIRDLGPDYIIFDYRAFWGKTIAEKLSVPAICVFPGMVFNKHIFYADPAEFVHRYFGGLYQTNSKEISKIISVLNRVFKQKHDIGDVSEGLIIDAGLNIVATHPFIQPYANELEDNYHFSGYSPLQQKLQEKFADTIPVEIIPKEKNLIYIYTTPADKYHVDWNKQFYPILFKAMQTIDRSAVMNYYCQDPVYDHLTDIPSNVYVNRFKHHSQLLPHSEVLICNGSYNVVHEALLHGKPMVVIPVGSEQFLLAKKIEDLGLGIYLQPTKLTTESIVDAVSQLHSDPKYGENCKTYGELLRQNSDDEKAVEIILGYINSTGA